VRRSPIARRTPLDRRSSLDRTTTLRRSRWNYRARPASEELVTARRLVRARSGGLCEAETPVCTREAAHAHHIRLRSQGGTHEPSNLLDVCAACHRYIHDHPEESYRYGFLRRGADR
jgi:hypothetical protein